MAKNKKPLRIKVKEKAIELYNGPTGNRLKSFAWRMCMMFIAGVLDIIIQEISKGQFDNSYTVIIGLVLGEISKFLNNKYRLNK